ncbi:MAG: hypothetical protein M3Q03_17550, partial [Chloroflexota bacterium]|nr:hypothetical protein [Chloroflexota bacterium]
FTPRENIVMDEKMAGLVARLDRAVARLGGKRGQPQADPRAILEEIQIIEALGYAHLKERWGGGDVGGYTWRTWQKRNNDWDTLISEVQDNLEKRFPQNAQKTRRLT